jgi:hypothetical protein
MTIKKTGLGWENGWGLYDTLDHCWLGDANGPKTFEEYDWARLAAQMADVQLGQAPGRTKAMKYDGGLKHLKDEVEVKMTALEALDKMEKGLV